MTYSEDDLRSFFITLSFGEKLHPDYLTYFNELRKQLYQYPMTEISLEPLIRILKEAFIYLKIFVEFKKHYPILPDFLNKFTDVYSDDQLLQVCLTQESYVKLILSRPSSFKNLINKEILDYPTSLADIERLFDEVPELIRERSLRIWVKTFKGSVFLNPLEKQTVNRILKALNLPSKYKNSYLKDTFKMFLDMCQA